MTQEEEVQLIVQTITHPAGFEINLFDLISIYVLEDGQYVVNEKAGFGNETVFQDPRKAAEFFVSRRKDERIGLDREGPRDLSADVQSAVEHEAQRLGIPVEEVPADFRAGAAHGLLFHSDNSADYLELPHPTRKQQRAESMIAGFRKVYGKEDK